MNMELNVLPVLGLNGITLRHGGHTSREQGVCAMEAVAWLAGEIHSDTPKCACPCIAAFMRAWNDRLPTDADRDRLLKPLLPELIGTRASFNTTKARGDLAWKWAGTFVAPAALSRAGFEAAAERVKADPSETNLRAAKDEVRAAALKRFGKAAFEDAYAYASAYAYAYASAYAYAYAYASASAYASAYAYAYASASAYAYAYCTLAKIDLAPLIAALEEGATQLVRQMIALKDEPAPATTERAR